VEGLKLLTQRTKDLMGEEFHATWIAAQVTDIYAKLDKSVECIIDHKRYFTCRVRMNIMISNRNNSRR
jgi:hypothetical protein